MLCVSDSFLRMFDITLIALLMRSIRTATRMTRPVTEPCQKLLMPIRFTPFWMTVIIKAPSRAPKADPVPPKADVQVFDSNATQFYAAQSGLAGLPGEALAHGVMKLASGERTLADGKNELAVRFESPEVNGVQLIKTYTFHRGSYAIDVTHEIVNHTSAPINPDLYLQLVREFL